MLFVKGFAPLRLFLTSLRSVSLHLRFAQVFLCFAANAKAAVKVLTAAFDVYAEITFSFLLLWQPGACLLSSQPA